MADGRENGEAGEQSENGDLDHGCLPCGPWVVADRQSRRLRARFIGT
jgi:hypothetical protein